MLLNESTILLNVEAKNKGRSLRGMGSNLNSLGLVKDSFVPAVIAREKEYPTGLPTRGLQWRFLIRMLNM
ncbi:PTS sugar transporter subunit IIA [Bacillus sp. JCM 19041]|uniref:PTS sugar transporter subunit IIA n=1 Tax=Bacillus sp. JCM 19041 TaxID=1460637 RepID=UPI000B2EF063